MVLLFKHYPHFGELVSLPREDHLVRLSLAKNLVFPEQMIHLEGGPHICSLTRSKTYRGVTCLCSKSEI